jgi:hypothetical protein
VVRPRRVMRFARLIHRRVRVLGGPVVRAAFGGNPSLPWLLLSVGERDQGRTSRSDHQASQRSVGYRSRSTFGGDPMDDRPR